MRQVVGEQFSFAQGRANASNPSVKLLISPAGVICDFTMACDLAPFNDVRVRQAFRLIVNRPEMLQVAQSGYGSIGNDLFGKGLPSYNDELPQRAYDPEKAASLLKAAGQSKWSMRPNCVRTARVVGVPLVVAVDLRPPRTESASGTPGWVWVNPRTCTS